MPSAKWDDTLINLNHAAADKTESALNRRDVIAGLGALSVSLAGCTTLQPTGSAKNVQRSIRPGEVWLDTAGKPIQAHGGAIIAVGKWFYWYGENKEFTDGKRGIESWGIRFYRSKDLYNWEDLGPLIPPDLSDPKSPLSPKIFPERPHILFNPNTRRFVCWIKIRPPGLAPQFRIVMTADRITGPYTMVQRELFPAGLPAGDFDLLVDEKSGKAYMYFEQDHKDVVCIELSDDWTNVTDRLTHNFPRTIPNVREGIACFQRDGRKYVTSSGMTGYFPNPSEVAVGTDFLGPFQVLGDLHPSDVSRTSFNSQISYIFKHPGKRDLYIALADRWLPQIQDDPRLSTGKLSGLVQGAIRKATAKPRVPFTQEERKVIMLPAALSNVNTSVSRYVWLPILFKDGRPVIEWRSEWRIEDFD